MRLSELFALKWRDINFDDNEVSITRSMVMQVMGPCKTEASQKPIPLDPYLAEALQQWRQHTQYKAPDDWVFASPKTNGRRPYWGANHHAHGFAARAFSSAQEFLSSEYVDQTRCLILDIAMPGMSGR